jgi:hypothetical protein
MKSDELKPTSWVGCGECDYLFACHEGESRCVRRPTAVERSLREILDLCDLGGVNESTEAYGWGDAIRRARQALGLPERTVVDESWLTGCPSCGYNGGDHESGCSYDALLAARPGAPK